MKALARQLRRHWDDILAYFDHRRTNAVLEGLNSIIQNVCFVKFLWAVSAFLLVRLSGCF